MPKNQYVSSLKPGETVDDVFVLSEKNLAQKKDGKSYLNLSFMDRTGTLKGVLWDNIEGTVDRISAGDFYACLARIFWRHESDESCHCVHRPADDSESPLRQRDPDVGIRRGLGR